MVSRLPAVALLALLLPAWLIADEPKLPEVAAFDKLVVDTLRDVHNKGADLYNLKKDFEGTYRLYQGALLTVRPFLAHRPAAQKLIDEGLTAAEAEGSMSQKAFRLHEAIEAVRSHLKAGGAPAKLKEPTAVAPKPKEKPPTPAPAPGKGLTGRVTLQGKPLTGAEVTLVTLGLPQPKVFTVPIQADGGYSFADIPPGKYVAIVTGKGVPGKYQTTQTSGLTIEVKAGANTNDIELK